MKIAAYCLLIWTTWASTAAADISGQFVPVPSEGGATPPPGFVSQDLVIETSTDWLAANLLLTLTEGSIYQDPVIVGIGPPSPALIIAIPSTRWDTYVTGSQGLAGGSPSSAGGAVDLGGDPIATFDASLVDLNWFTTATDDIGTFSIGRFTLSDDAEGAFTLRLDSLDRSAYIVSGTIHNGVITAIPEAGTSTLLGVSAVALVAVLCRKTKGQRRR